MESYKPSQAFRMATAIKSKYSLEMDEIALLLLRGHKEDALKLMEEWDRLKLPLHVWWNVCWGGVLRWCIIRDKERNERRNNVSIC